MGKKGIDKVGDTSPLFHNTIPSSKQQKAMVKYKKVPMKKIILSITACFSRDKCDTKSSTTTLVPVTWV